MDSLKRQIYVDLLIYYVMQFQNDVNEIHE